MKRVLLCLILLSGAAAIGQGERWTVQTAAFQDYRQATSQIDQLEALGFDAYTEFAMSGGQQYTRVRIGCFHGRAAAAEFAGRLAGAITAEAVPQPLGETATPAACVEWDVGFIKPEAWTIVRRQPDILFRVEVGGQVGYLRHAGEEWQFSHTAPAPATPEPASSATFREVRVGGVTLVQARLGDGNRVNACSGDLLWQHGYTAVVEGPDSVLACVVDDSPPGRSP